MYYYVNPLRSIILNQQGAQRSPLLVLSGVLMLLCVALGSVPVAARSGQPDRGVVIPDRKNLQDSGKAAASVMDSEWLVDADEQTVWSGLREALSRLDINFDTSTPSELQLTTAWVLWQVDSKTGRGRSKPPRIGLSREQERHRFVISVSSINAHRSVIKITDAAAQKEIDIAPDSAYAWLEWKAVEVYTGAANSFLQRLQPDIESAMLSSYVPAIAVKNPVLSGADTLIRSSSAGAALKKNPAAVVTNKTVAPASVDQAVTQVAHSDGGLLIDEPPKITWVALMQALKELGIAVKTVDAEQGLVTTQWIRARYMNKNQRFSLQSNKSRLWVFGALGEGQQRHRFELVMIPVEQGKATMIRAYHTGYQEQIDKTPDSSQTLLAWEERKTDAVIASAFLRKLRIRIAR